MFRRILRFVDWRFIIALCLLVGVAAAVHGALEAGQERDRVIAAATVEREQASAERDRLLKGQAELSNKYERLIRWLNGQNIDVPPEVLMNGHTIRVEDDDDNDDSDSSDDSDNDNNRRTPTTRPPTTRPPANGGGGGSDDGGSKSGS